MHKPNSFLENCVIVDLLNFSINVYLVNAGEYNRHLIHQSGIQMTIFSVSLLKTCDVNPG